MIGPEGAAQLVADRLDDRLPYRLVGIELAHGLEVGTLGTAAVVLPYDKLRLAVEEWPAILVLGQALRRLGPGEVDGTATVYRARYALRVLVWVRGEDELDTDTRRKRYVLAVREALLELTVVAELTVDPLSLAESYSDVVIDDAGQTIAGAWVDVDVVIEERLEQAPIDLLGTPAPDRTLEQAVDLDTAVLPPHPGI